MYRRNFLGAVCASLLALISLAFTQTARAQDTGSIEGLVVTTEGRGVPDAHVVLMHEGTAVARTASGDGGHFAFADVAPGRYTIVAERDGVGRGEARAAVVAGATTRVRIALRPAAGAISGIVIGGDAQRPIEGAAVVLFQGRQEVARTRTNTEGRFDFPNLRPGHYVLAASKDGVGHGRGETDVRPAQTSRIRISLRGGGGGNTEPGAIIGIVTAGDQPVAGANVVLRHGDTIVAQTVSNDQGIYHFPSVRPGEYIVVGFKRGVGEGHASATVVADQSVRVPIVLVPPPPPQNGTIEGLVGTENGPTGGADVAIARDGHVVARTVTDRNGHFVFPRLAPGHYLLMAVKRGVGSGRIEADVTAGETTNVRIRLVP